MPGAAQGLAERMTRVGTATDTIARGRPSWLGTLAVIVILIAATTAAWLALGGRTVRPSPLSYQEYEDAVRAYALVLCSTQNPSDAFKSVDMLRALSRDGLFRQLPPELQAAGRFALGDTADLKCP